MRVVVCVLTYLRPKGLKRLLEGLAALTFTQNPEPMVDVVVVDNDPKGSAEAFCRELNETGYRFQVHYAHETQRGIPIARNRGLAEAPDEADFICFLDDDEVPEPCWLDVMLDVQRTYQADVVAGPVMPYFPEGVPAWIEQGKFFDRARPKTGTRLALAGAGNVLMRSELITQQGFRFDPQFALSGGEDTHFFMKLNQAGYKLVWADAALAYEWTPLSRMNMGWLLKRSFRLGTSISLCELALFPKHKVRLQRLVKGGGRIAQGLVQLPLGFLGKHKLAQALRHIYYGVGMLVGLTGTTYNEYQQTHGR